MVSLQCHGLLADSITYDLVPTFDVGCEGENVTWDFSMMVKDDIGETATIQLYKLGNRILRDDNGSLTTYTQLENKLKITREETPLYSMDFTNPIICMTYPFRYGMNLSSPYLGKGKYENKFHLSENGTSTVSADSYGTLILSKGDTLRNVLRVHSAFHSDITINDICTDEYVCTLEKTTDEYEWYAKDYRYPVLRLITNNLENDGGTIAYSSIGYKITSRTQDANADYENDDLRETVPQRHVIDYDIVVNGKSATITLNIQEDAHVDIALADSGGILHWHHESDVFSGECYQTTIPLSGLHRGQYVIYINTNGDIYTNTISIE